VFILAQALVDFSINLHHLLKNCLLFSKQLFQDAELVRNVLHVDEASQVIAVAKFLDDIYKPIHGSAAFRLDKAFQYLLLRLLKSRECIRAFLFNVTQTLGEDSKNFEICFDRLTWSIGIQENYDGVPDSGSHEVEAVCAFRFATQLKDTVTIDIVVYCTAKVCSADEAILSGTPNITGVLAFVLIMDDSRIISLRKEGYHITLVDYPTP
jgi:hypothetical protein